SQTPTTSTPGTARAASRRPDWTRAPTPTIPSWTRPLGESGGAANATGERETTVAATVPAALRARNCRRLSLLGILTSADIELVRRFPLLVKPGRRVPGAVPGVPRIHDPAHIP